MKFIKVYNVGKNNSDFLRKEAWEEKKKEKITLCSCKGCIQKASVISKVKISDLEEGKIVYNIPVCDKCSSKEEDYYVDVEGLAI